MGRRALEVMLHPLEEAQVVIEARGRLAVAMLFAGIEDQPHGRLAAELQMPVELAGLPDVDARVVLAMQDQERGAAFAGMIDRAALEQQGPVFPGTFQRVT